MSNYEHDKLIERISMLNQPPSDDTEYARWITAEMQVDLLRKNAEEDELIMCAIGNHTFIHTVAVNEDSINPLDIDDLLEWSGNPFSTAASYNWGKGSENVWIGRGSPVYDSMTLSSARPLIFGREMPGFPMTSYFEVVQEYTHLADIHHIPERRAYCRFNDQGDWEYVVTISDKSAGSDLSFVTFKREPLEEYLAASRSVLVRMFDFTLLRFGEFSRWPDSPEEIVKCSSLSYRQKIDRGKAGYTRGIQIVRPSRPNTAIFSAIKGERRADEQYVEFIAYDFRNDCVTTVSTDPQATTNYFTTEGNSLPFELSPAFFKPDVLAKYKSDSEKYVIGERNIWCRGGWMLRGYDVNEAGQIHAYICDLRKLPHSEQVYWESFNERPKARISERAFENDFKGEWSDRTDPLERIKSILGSWEESNVSWWKLRDAALVRRVTTPLTDSVDEWAQGLQGLTTLIIEGFEIKAIRIKLDEMRLAWEHEERSLLLLERVLFGDQSVQKLDGLRLVQRIRSKIGSHARGSEAQDMAKRAIREHGSYTAHFHDVCRTVEGELQYIEQAFDAAAVKLGQIT